MRIPSWVTCLAAVTAIRIAAAAVVPILPEEAYHWNFALHPDWSYFDHPPMIAWSIAAGRALCGDTPLGVRLVPILWSILGTAALARLAARFHGEKAAAWTVILLALEPVTFLAAGSGFPDSPMLCFWAFAMLCVWNAVEKGSPGWWLSAGASLGAAMLSKYTAIFLVPSVIGYLVLSPRDRKWLASPWPYLASLAALAVFTPVLYWNWTHDWASFRFQSAGRLGESEGVNLVFAWRFVLGQWLGVFPLTMPLAIAAVARLVRPSRREDLFLALVLAPIFLFFLGVSAFRAAHLLWPVPGHLGLTVAMAGMVGGVAEFYRRRKAWLAAGAAAVVLGTIAHAAFFLPRISPFKGLYGWKEAAGRAMILRESMPGGAFILGVGRRYTCASELAFHLRAPFEVHGKNLLGHAALQYDYWADPGALAGRDAVVVVEGDRVEHVMPALRKHFESLESAGTLEVAVGRDPLIPSPPLRFEFYKAFGYRSE